MEPRTISIGLIAIVAAFAVAFGAGKATSSKTATAGVRAAAIKVAAPPAVSSVQVGGAIPALQAKAQNKSPAKKKKSTSKTTATTNSTASAPSTTNSAPQTQTKVTPKVQAPVKKTPAKPKSTTGGGGAVNGGGVDG